MTGWDDDEDEDNEDLRLHSSTHVQPAQPDSNDFAEEATHIKKPFIDSYLKSIRPARDIICGQWKECTWDKKSFNIEAHTNDDEVKSPFTPLCFYAPYLRSTNNH
jgi:hypothetical protein